MNMRTAILGVVLLAAVGCGSGADRPGPAPPPEGRPAAAASHVDELEVPVDMLRDLRLTTAEVQTASSAGSEATILGEMRVNEDAYAEVAAQVPGRVTRVLAGLGDRVRAGQPLAELQSAALGRARAAVMAAAGQVTLAQSVLARTRALAAERIAPERAVQEADAGLAASEAAAAAADASLRALGVSPDDPVPAAGAATFLVRAPLAGVVIARDVVVGQAVDEQAPALFKVADLSRLWLIVHAFERDAVRIVPGGEVEVTMAALPGRQVSGRVTHVGGQVDPQSRTVPIRITVANPAGQLRPGMSASARLPLGDEAARILTVPAGALQRLGDSWVVFIPRDEGHFTVREVGRGRDLEGVVEIVHGVTARERVVVDGSFVLKAEAEKARGLGDDDPH